MKVHVGHYDDYDYDDSIARWVIDPEEYDEIEVELPDAVVTEWRAVRARLIEIEAYVADKVGPVIEQREKDRREAYERKLREAEERANKSRAQQQTEWLAQEMAREEEYIKEHGKLPNPQRPQPLLADRPFWQAYQEELKALMERYDVLGRARDKNSR